jgi:ribose-phosphate pyrophosphokinase
MVSLPFFNAGAVKDFDMAYKEGIFYRIIGTNSVFHGRDLLDKEWYVQADITELFARVISRLHHGRSISPLLDNRKFIQILIDNTQAQAQEPKPGASASNPESK